MKTEFPKSVGSLDKLGVGTILRRALRESDYESQADLARAMNIPRNTLVAYFTAKSMPSQETWDLLTRYLAPETSSESGSSPAEILSVEQQAEAEHHVDKIHAACLLLKDELEYFQNSLASVREVLKKELPAKDVGYIVTLFRALYDEGELAVWKFF